MGWKQVISPTPGQRYKAPSVGRAPLSHLGFDIYLGDRWSSTAICTQASWRLAHDQYLTGPWYTPTDLECLEIAASSTGNG